MADGFRLHSWWKLFPPSWGPESCLTAFWAFLYLDTFLIFLPLGPLLHVYVTALLFPTFVFTHFFFHLLLLLPADPMCLTLEHQSSASLQPRYLLLTLHHKYSVELQKNNEDILAGEENHQLVEHLLLHHEVEPVEQERAILESHCEQQAPDFAGAAGGEWGWSPGAAEGTTLAVLRRPHLWGSCLSENQRKLHERPREQGQADDDNCLVGFDFGLLEGVEDVQDVSTQSHIHHEKLWELVTWHVPLGHEPATQNQDYQHGLLQASYPVLWVQILNPLDK